MKQINSKIYILLLFITLTRAANADSVLNDGGKGVMTTDIRFPVQGSVTDIGLINQAT